MLFRLLTFLAVAAMCFPQHLSADDFDAQTRLNQIQVVGTHNSYHVEPHPSIMKLIRRFVPSQAVALEYSHRPLPEQLAKLGIRQIELDVFADPNGAHYAEPMGLKLVADYKFPPVPDPDPTGALDQPGLKVIHEPDFDFATTVKTFAGALRQVKEWSDANPNHIPVMVLVEVKQNRISPLFKKPMPFDAAALDAVDAEILSVFKPEQIITPDSVRGTAPSLREVITGKGWPLLDKVRGKLMFALDNGGEIRDLYLKGHESLRDRVLFASVPADHPAAAFMRVNDPISSFKQIQTLVKQGFIVRTRADASTKQARTGDASRRDKALASGAQFVSTDYPEANKAFSDYSVQIPNVARRNPVSGRTLVPKKRTVPQSTGQSK